MMSAERPLPVAPQSGLRLLLIAYEFPPSPSPQSLRWAYLARELALAGHEIHVLAPEHPGSGHGLPELPPTVVVHRTFAGPGMGLLNVLARRGRRRTATPAGGAVEAGAERAETTAYVPAALNWKGHVHNALNRWKVSAFHGMQRLLSRWFFPDGRAEWYPWAKRCLKVLLREVGPDLVISSHEPATTLSLGLIAHRAGVPWIADLGDPVLAPYTPKRWKRKALALEREVCASASMVLTTTAAAASILSERHALSADRLQVFTQGFDGRTREERIQRSGETLELLYTGSFYEFRRSSALIEAVMRTAGVRLSIASIEVPDEVRAASETCEAVRLLGFLPHTEVTHLQRRYDVLVNIANTDPCQIPGKFYEYLGSGRPVLHVGSDQDAAAELLRLTGRGWICAGDTDELGEMLAELRAAFEDGNLASSMDLSRDPVRHYDWREIGSRLDRTVRMVADAGQNTETRKK